MANSVLTSLLDATARQNPEYRGGLSNHLPMALHALSSLGADGHALQRFAETYLQRTGIGELSTRQAPLGDWRTGRGQIQAYPNLRATFATLIDQHGLDATLVDALPKLWPGVAGAAFHGVIRVAHAWEAGHSGEIAAGLAYWAARWQSTSAAGVPRTMSLQDWLSEAEDAAIHFRSDRGLIMDRMAEAAETVQFQAWAPRLNATEGSISEGAAWAAQLYAETRNFTILHVVTALRAIAVLSRLSAPVPEVWNAVFAAIQSSGMTGRQVDRIPARSWPELTAAARSSSDEHVIKLIHACSQLETLWPEPAFKVAATCALK